MAHLKCSVAFLRLVQVLVKLGFQTTPEAVDYTLLSLHTRRSSAHHQSRSLFGRQTSLQCLLTAYRVKIFNTCPLLKGNISLLMSETSSFNALINISRDLCKSKASLAIGTNQICFASLCAPIQAFSIPNKVLGTSQNI